MINAFGADINSAKSHYLNNGYSECRSITYFSPTNYLNCNSDLPAAFGSNTEAAIKHFIINGYWDGSTVRNISSKDLIDTFSSSNTLKEIETINKIDIDFITYKSLSDIEALNYLATHDNLGKLYRNDIEAAKSHYENHGKYEGRI